MDEGPPFVTRLLSTFPTLDEQKAYVKRERKRHYKGRSYLRGDHMDRYCTNVIHKLKTYPSIIDADKLEAACIALRARVDLELKRDDLEEREKLWTEMHEIFRAIDP